MGFLINDAGKTVVLFEKDKIKFISYTIKKNKVQRDINVKTVDVNIKAVKKKGDKC